MIIPEPFYANYLGFGHTSFIRIVPIPSSIENGISIAWSGEIWRADHPYDKGYFPLKIPNPTGCLYSKEELAQLMKLVIKYDLFLIVDEAYLSNFVMTKSSLQLFIFSR